MSAEDGAFVVVVRNAWILMVVGGQEIVVDSCCIRFNLKFEFHRAERFMKIS